MVKFKHHTMFMIDSFNMSKKDFDRIDELDDSSIFSKLISPTEAIERIFIDEQLSDNAKMWLIFNIGRIFAKQE